MNYRNGNRQPFKRRLLCLIMAVWLLLLVPLTGCTSVKTLVQRTAAYQYFNPPQMILTGDYPLTVPNVEGCYNSEAINERINEYFAPIIAAVSSADAEVELLVPEYCMEGSKGGQFTIHGRLRCLLGGEIKLPDIYLNSGEAAFESETADTSEYDDAVLTAGKLFLDSIGLLDSFGEMTETAELPEMYGLLVQLYERLSGVETDISRFSPDITASELYKKLLALGMPVYPDEIDTTDPAPAEDIYFALGMASVMKGLFNDYYGNSSLCVSRSDAVDMTRLFMGFCKDSPYIYDSWNGCVERFEAADLYGIPEDKLTRQAFASMWVSDYVTIFGDVISTDDMDYVPNTSDTEDTDCVTSMYMGFMDTFPSYACFSPEYYVHMFELPEYCRRFTWSCYNNWRDINGYTMSGEYTYEDIVRGISRAMIYLSRFEPSSDKKSVINDRDYSWYVTQYSTGRYGEINCMPTITEMAARWYFGPDTELTAQKLREDWLPEYTEGWYMFQVQESLEKYDIPNEEIDFAEDTGTDTLCAELDKGRIILTQMSEAEYGVSGHCFVIYGYRRCGDSVRFLVHDPGIYMGTDEFGRYPGDSICIDSAYVDWIICRITCIVVSVGE